MKNSTEEFSSRWGLVLASLGMAIGAGNLWRFPRLAGQYGGTFLILWIGFLLIWSIPILLAEFSIGKKAKKCVTGSFASIAGKQLTWMGFFITLCTLGITFYYSVVTAWALQYLGFSIENLFNNDLISSPEALQQHWQSVSNGNWATVTLHIVAVSLGVTILYRGIRRGLEWANRLLIPTLFLLLIVISVVSLSMGNGWKGLDYMFSIDPALFSDPVVWIEALSQSAWSTGAGWGLMMTLSSYSREKEDVTLNIFIGGFGNNTASLVAGMAILPAVFALAPTEEVAISSLKTGSQALTFTIIPQLFTQIKGGTVLSLVFFGAFFLAAFSSLLPMLEMFIKSLIDLKIERKKATFIVALCCIAFGFPSAWSLDFFSNQDWVWGIGLVVSGLFILVATIRYGVPRFKEKLIDQDSDFRVSNAYFMGSVFLNVALAIVLIYWWLSQGYSQHPWFDVEGNWNVFDVYSNATVLTQWGTVLLIGILLNRFLYNAFSHKK